MRIVIVTPNTTTLPPPKDGGTERIVYEIAKGLANRGHDIFLYARGGSLSNGTLIYYPFDSFGDHEIGAFVKQTMPPDIDIIHDHTFSSTISKVLPDQTIVSTQHIPYKTRGKNPIYVSKDALNSVGGGQGVYIYNGLQSEDYQFSETKKNYLLFMGRIIPDKGVVEAIKVAERTNSRLIIAGPKHNISYFNKQIAPRLRRNKKLTYVGSVGGQERQELLKNARCLLFPTRWREPFGLVMIEALACGTPVLALKQGAVSEVLKGLPEFICTTPREMAKKLRFVRTKYTPAHLRNYVNANFSTQLMIDRYIQYYEEVIRNTKRA